MTEDKKMENFSRNKEEYQPKVLVFACNWCSYAGADMAGVSRLQMPPNCRVVRVMCSARVSPEMVLSALFKGMDAVLVLGCHPGDCHYSEGNFYTRRRALVLEKMLDLLGIAKERFQVRWVSAAEGEKFAKTIREVVEQVTSLGPNLSNEKFFGEGAGSPGPLEGGGFSPAKKDPKAEIQEETASLHSAESDPLLIGSPRRGASGRRRQEHRKK